MDELLAGFWMVASLGCIGLWVITALSFRRSRRLGLLHSIVVVLTIVTLVLYDLIVAGAVLDVLERDQVRMALTFAIGVQVVDALAAFIFVSRSGAD